MTQIFAERESGSGNYEGCRRETQRGGLFLNLNPNLILIPPSLDAVATEIKNKIKNKIKIRNKRMPKLVGRSCVIADLDTRA